MSIASEIERIQTNVDNSLAAVAAYGVRINEGANSNDLPALIAGIADKVINKDSLSLGIASDGLIYIFVDGVPVGTGVPQGQTADVYGYIDENNHITFTGKNVPDGSYTCSFDMENGSTVPIGAFVKDTNTYYSITSNLTNCTNSNNTKTVVEGESYSATITANSGYTLKSVSVTMGGNAVSVSNGVINIASVTGDIVITAVAEVSGPAYINQIPISTNKDGSLFVGTNGEKGYKTGYRISASSGNESAQSNVEVTGFIPAKLGDTMYIKGITANTSGTNVFGFYNSNREATKTAGNANTGVPMKDLFSGGVNGEVRSIVLNATNVQNNNFNSDVAYIRVSADVINANSIITINQPIE